MSKYLFELFCIEPQDINNDVGVQNALSFSAQLWEDKIPTQIERDGVKVVAEPESDISIKIFSVDTSKIWTGEIETAFILKVECSQFEVLDLFRGRLLKHVRDTLRFKHKRVLRDDVSTEICNRLYPEINSVEIQLRRYLIKFFIQKIGLNWWELTADNSMVAKVSSRRNDRKDTLASFIDTDIEYIDFNELGELIYKQSSGFNQPDKVLQKLGEITSIDDLYKFKAELDGNYTKYFKKYFKEKSFEAKWNTLTKIRNKVAHQGSFHKVELDHGFELAIALKEIITEAENEIDTLVLSIDEKVALRNTAIENLGEIQTQSQPTPEAVESKPESKHDNKVTAEGPKIKGKLEVLEKQYITPHGHKVITENEMLDELEAAEFQQYTNYVGLKWFVTTYLANKQYSIGFSYSLLNILVEQGRIEIYSIRSGSGYEIKAIRGTAAK